MSKITYTDKAPFQTNENVPIENKCTADDMNEIKEVVNTNADDLLQAKNDIEDLKNNQSTELDKKVQKLINNSINVTTDLSSNINIQDCSDLEGRIDVEGNSVQEEEATPEAPVEIQNVEGNVNVSVCNKNLFDKKNPNVLNAYISANKLTAESQNRIIWLPCKSNTTYTVSKKAGQRFAMYFSEIEPAIGVTISEGISNNTASNLTSTSLENSKYIIVYVANYNVGTEIPWQDILDSLQIEENPIATEYVEHQSQTITFPLSKGQKLMKGDYLADDGIHHKRKQREFDGTENWEIYIWQTAPHTKTTIFSLTNILPQKNDAVRYCNYFNVVANTVTNLNKDEEYCLNNSAGTIYFSISNEIATTIEGFKNWLAQQKQAGTPVILEYELAEEEIEPYTPEQQEAYNKLQKVLPYKLVTNIFTDLALLRFNYIADTKTYIDNKTTNIQNQINTINELLNNESQQNEEIPENQNTKLLE